MSERLLEAQDRELWRPRSNGAHERLRELAGAARQPIAWVLGRASVR